MLSEMRKVCIIAEVQSVLCKVSSIATKFAFGVLFLSSSYKRVFMLPYLIEHRPVNRSYCSKYRWSLWCIYKSWIQWVLKQIKIASLILVQHLESQCFCLNKCWLSRWSATIFTDLTIAIALAKQNTLNLADFQSLLVN